MDRGKGQSDRALSEWHLKRARMKRDKCQIGYNVESVRNINQIDVHPRLSRDNTGSQSQGRQRDEMER